MPLPVPRVMQRGHRRRSSSIAACVLFAMALPCATIGAQCALSTSSITSSARALALGDVRSTSRDADVLFSSPSQIAIARGVSVAAGGGQRGRSGAMVATVTRLGSVGIAVGAAGGRERERQTCLASPPPDTARVRAVAAIGLGSVVKGWRVGGAARYAVVVEKDSIIARALGDIGLGHSLPSLGGAPVNFAVAIQNLGPTLGVTTRLRQPLRGVAGLSVSGPVESFDLGLAIEGVMERWAGDGVTRFGAELRGGVAGGAEVSYVWLDGYAATVRVGGRTVPARATQQRFTAGLGLTLDRLNLDYAVEPLTGGRLVHLFGIRIL